MFLKPFLPPRCREPEERGVAEEGTCLFSTKEIIVRHVAKKMIFSQTLPKSGQRQLSGIESCTGLSRCSLADIARNELESCKHGLPAQSTTWVVFNTATVSKRGISIINVRHAVRRI